MPDTLRQFKASIFQALSHPTRIGIVEQLRDGELAAGVLIERLGLEQANASQHLAVLRAKHIVTARKEGNQVFYSVRDPLLIDVLDIMRRYFQAHIEEAMAMLTELNHEGDGRAKSESDHAGIAVTDLQKAQRKLAQEESMAENNREGSHIRE